MPLGIVLTLIKQFTFRGSTISRSQDVESSNEHENVAQQADELMDDWKSHSVDVLTLDELEARSEMENNNVWAADNWISVGASQILCGLSQLGKSTLGFDLWVSLATGEPWMGRVPTTKMPVYLLDFENPRKYIIRHLKDMCDARGIPYDLVKKRLYVSGKQELFKTCNGFNIEQTIRNIQFIEEQTGQEHGIFVVDSLRAGFGDLPGFKGDEWEWYTNRVREVGRMLDRVIDATGWGCVGMHHDNSGGNPNGVIQRAGAFNGFLHYAVGGNNVYSVAPRTLEVQGRFNEGERPDRLSVAYMDGRLVATPNPRTDPSQGEKRGKPKQREDKAGKYLAVLRKHPEGLTESAIQKEIGGRIETARRYLQKLESQGDAERCDIRVNNKPVGGWKAVD